VSDTCWRMMSRYQGCWKVDGQESEDLFEIPWVGTHGISGLLLTYLYNIDLFINIFVHI